MYFSCFLLYIVVLPGPKEILFCRRAAVLDPSHRHHGLLHGQQPASEHQGILPAAPGIRGCPQPSDRQGRGEILASSLIGTVERDFRSIFLTVGTH